MSIRYLILLFFSLPIISSAQDCLCQDEFVQICYYSADDVCPPGNDCRFTLDGQFMIDGLTPKLENPQLFGPQGIVNCPVQLQKIIDVPSADYINEQKCDIVFIGVFSDSHFEPKTDLPLEELDFIKEWSVQCEKNLVIVSQFEASRWGYSMTNENQNPNTPDLLNSTSSIFDGPFGTITEFKQSGTYQGVITGTPSTPFDILGRDANNKPTIVLDQATNDIVLGDISILTQFGNLIMSPGNQVLVDNDILAANLFALGCGITDGTFTTVQDILLCSDETFILPNGEIVSDAGLYIDSLKSTGDCDSLLFTRIEKKDDSEVNINYVGCKGDQYSIQVGSIIYDETNPFGIQTIQNSAGCDSLVEVNFEFVEQDTTYLNYELCDGQTIEVAGQTYQGTVAENFVVPVENGCDSVIFLDVLTFEPTEYASTETLIIDVNKGYQFPFFFPNAQSVSYEPSEAFSCQNCDEPLLERGFAPPIINVTATDVNGCDFAFSLEPFYTCAPFFANVINLNSPTRENREFGAISTCPLEDYQLEIYDRWGSQIFATNDANIKWNGTKDGKDIAMGVYIYTFQYSQLSEMKRVVGSLTVLD